MDPEFKDKSERLFIAVMRIAMGILGVFSFCYIISAIGLIDWEYYLPKPNVNPVVLKDDTSQDKITIEDEPVQNFKQEEKIEEEEDLEFDENDSFFNRFDKNLKGYNKKLEDYFYKGFYYDLSKDYYEKYGEKLDEKVDDKKDDSSSNQEKDWFKEKIENKDSYSYKDKEEEKDDYFYKDKEEKESYKEYFKDEDEDEEENKYYYDEWGWFPKFRNEPDPETGLYNFDEIFPGLFSFY